MNRLSKYLTAWAVIVALAVSSVSAATVGGRVRAGGKPLQGVIVSDGVELARTDAEGRFTLEVADDAPFVWVVTPSGYVADHSTGSPRFWLPVDGRESYEFDLKAAPGNFTLIAVGDPQPKTKEHLGRFHREVMPELKEQVAAIRQAGRQPALLVLGDIVWDSPKLAEPMREAFAQLDAPVYTAIGNHDHLIAVADDAGSAANFSAQFGPTYYAFDLGRTHFVVLDNIIYHGQKKYEEEVDERQLQWIEKYVKLLPAGDRLCISMHAPVQKYWRKNPRTLGGADRLLELTRGFDRHFITGHTHVNSNFDVEEGAIEHNVGQVAGNLWHAPLNQDGSPRGYALFSEGAEGLEWHYKTLGKPLDYQFKIYGPGEVEGHPKAVVAKVWNWDPRWKVEWSEDGRKKGEMVRYESTPDPEYVRHLEEVQARCEAEGRKLPHAEYLRRSFFYFGAVPSKKARRIEVVVTDRFGNRYTENYELKK